MLRSILKYSSRTILVLFIAFMIANISGCFQFRTANSKKIEKYQKIGLDLKGDTYDFEGRKMNYLQTNQSADSLPVVIYIHGSPGSSQDFDKNMKDSTMRSRYEMVTVDRPGFGYSGFGKAEPSLDRQAKSIKPLIDKFKGRRIYVIGHSYGGPVVARIGMLFSDNISGLIIVAGSISAELEPKDSWRKLINFFLIDWLAPRSLTTSNDEIQALKSELTRIEADWEKISCPVVVLQGKDDFLVPHENADFAQQMLQHNDKTIIRKIEDVDHFIPFTRHHLITEALSDLEKLAE